MDALFVSLLVSSACTWYGAPRLFRYFDTHCSRKHLASLLPPDSLSAQQTYSNTSSEILRPMQMSLPGQPRTTQDLAQLCDALARSSRTGNTAHEAIMTLAPELFDEILAVPNASITDEQLLLIRSCIVDNYFIAAALDQAALIMRENHLFHLQVKTAAAHSLLTIRILSLLPIGALGVALLTQSQLRSQFFSTPILAIFLVGVVLNIAGRSWAQALIRKTSSTTTPPLIEFTQHLCVSLRAGYSTHDALLRIKNVNEVCREVGQQLTAHQPLTDALHILHQSGPVGISLANILTQATSDGLPVVHTVQQLSSEVRTERRIALETRTQELPSKLTFPVVFCTLPSFLMLTVLPLVFSQLSNLSLPLTPT